MAYIKYVFGGVLLALITACAPSRIVQPLEEGEQVLTGSLGGPVVNVPGVANMPIPFATLGYARGLKHQTTVFGNWHATAFAFGVNQLDLGAVKEVWKNDSLDMGASLTAVANLALDNHEYNFKFWPQLDVNYYWNYHRRMKEVRAYSYIKKSQMLYAGLSNWFELSSTGAHERQQEVRWIWNPHIGHRWKRDRWMFDLELKLIAPNHPNTDVVLDYASVTGDKGALGLYFGVNYRLKNKKPLKE